MAYATVLAAVSAACFALMFVSKMSQAILSMSQLAETATRGAKGACSRFYAWAAACRR